MEKFERFASVFASEEIKVKDLRKKLNKLPQDEWKNALEELVLQDNDPSVKFGFETRADAENCRNATWEISFIERSPYDLVRIGCAYVEGYTEDEDGNYIETFEYVFPRLTKENIEKIERKLF